jgi:hypothetical protein
VAEWHDWNATMLPEIDESSTSNFTGDELADHIGTSERPKRAVKRTILRPKRRWHSLTKS